MARAHCAGVCALIQKYIKLYIWARIICAFLAFFIDNMLFI